MRLLVQRPFFTLPSLGEGARRADEGLAENAELSELARMDKSPKTLARARSLRKAETEAERKLWGYLRGKRLQDYKFRRQFPVPPYIVDFVCLSHQFVVEVDGATHGDAREIEYDGKRTDFLRVQGFEVYRVNNADVYENISNVLDGILIVLHKRMRDFQMLRTKPPSRCS